MFSTTPYKNAPTSDGVVLRSKLVDERYQVQTLIALVDLAFEIFLGFLRNSRKHGLGSLRETPMEGIPLQAQFLQANNCH